jgi:hypothetical protein
MSCPVEKYGEAAREAGRGAREGVGARLARNLGAWFGVLVVLFSPSVINAATFEIKGLLNGAPVDARAVFTFGPGSLFVQLTNLQKDPRSVIQNVSGIRFGLAQGNDPVLGGSLTGSWGSERTVSANGSFTDGPAVGAGWAYSAAASKNGGYFLTVLGTLTGPEHTLIGAPGDTGVYSAAGGSIAGNAPHNPFLGETVKFLFAIDGIDPALADVSFAQIFFGTAPGVYLEATCLDCSPPLQAAPEPLTIASVGVALFAMWARPRRGVAAGLRGGSGGG